ncbi:MAG: 16S rRNA (guanine(966)-N(2))-methyltransferase RsmD [Akkermansiaceae bacterium]|nr:16S rRNA (guanine(966)-N(2))-methyltransferase RsmD [Akkermansiaceae bacterium]NNM31153.1 16S rRNA (guanine(966)-N(2))-methyltransferase RsmD [Akkermansiaceae bacterium]
MRIIAGSSGGIRLQVPERVARPSTDRLREALFAILGEVVPGARVLDLFAGSGALGIEALSRGAAEARFVEENASACEVIRANLSRARLAGTVVKSDVFAFLRRGGGPFDLVVADPPYARPGRADLAGRLLEGEGLRSLLAAGGLVVIEVESERDAPEAPGWTLADRRVYGSSAILFYEAEAAS